MAGDAMNDYEYCPHCGKELRANSWGESTNVWADQPYVSPPIENQKYLNDFLARRALSYAEIGAICTTASDIIGAFMDDLPTRATNLPGASPYYRRSSVRATHYKAVLTKIPKHQRR